MQESGNSPAYATDPMQVNVPGDWNADKTDLGLQKGVCPGPDLSINAGINWLAYKAYAYGANGDAIRFRGWSKAVERYNGGGDPDYIKKVYRYYNQLNNSSSPVQ